MPRVALATWDHAPAPIPDHENTMLVAALEAEGVEAELAVWDRAQDWSRFDLCMVKTTWDYPQHLEKFLAWIDDAGAATALWNPPEVIRWNVNKAYLLEMERKGVRIPPTRLLPRGERADLSALVRETGWSRGVLKPTVGVASQENFLLDSRNVAAGQAHLDRLLAQGGVLFQPFLPSISEGEASLLYFDGQFSHAVRKRPARGDYRVQASFGGSSEAMEPTPEHLALAEAALRAVGRPLLYARVDLVDDLEGRPCLMELELIEPLLFLEKRPEGARNLARAIVQRLEQA